MDFWVVYPIFPLDLRVPSCGSGRAVGRLTFSHPSRVQTPVLVFDMLINRDQGFDPDLHVFSRRFFDFLNFARYVFIKPM
jgi:hypothetical protein